jgi:hypothetical protein
MLTNWLMNAMPNFANVAGITCRETLRSLSAQEGKSGFQRPEQGADRDRDYRAAHNPGGLRSPLS